MMRPIKNIVIVGGGTAGWLTAGVIAAKHRSRMAAGFTVTLVESPNTPIIGVGEGTWPTLRTTLAKIGVSETDFFRECDAAFKQGAKFARWTTGAETTPIIIPLMLPQGFHQLNLAPHWLAGATGRSFCDMVTPQGRICDEGLAPKTIATRRNMMRSPTMPITSTRASSRRSCSAIAARSWACAMSLPMCGSCWPRTATFAASTPSRHGEIEGDLFIDCTGFRSLLLGEALGVPFKDCGDVLFCDTALAMQVPYESEDSPISAHHLHRPVGRMDLGHRPADPPRHRPCLFQPPHFRRRRRARAARLSRPGGQGPAGPQDRDPLGHRETFWKRNCVAVGLAAGFLEPLEASAIVLIELSAKLIAEQMPACREVMDMVASRFNATTHYRWGRIIDFLKLHYVLTSAPTRPSGGTMCAPETIPDRLQDLMLLWKYQSPWFHDEFDRVEKSSRPPATNMSSTAWASAPKSSRKRWPAMRGWPNARCARTPRRPSGCAPPCPPPRPDPQDPSNTACSRSDHARFVRS
jgi:tryptophan halogenase